MHAAKTLLTALLLSAFSHHAIAQQTHRVFDDNTSAEVSAEIGDPGAPNDSVRKGAIKTTRDDQGRLIKVETVSGVTHSFSYDHSGRVAQVKDQAGNVTVAVYDSTSSAKIIGAVKLPLKQSFNQGNNRKLMSFNDGTELDPSTGGDLIEFYRSQGDMCALVCLGIWDSINSFVGNLANWIGVGAATYSVLGAIEGILSGAAGVEVLAWAGLGAFAGTAVVIAFAGGYLVGTAGYNIVTHVIYSDGRVVAR